MNKRLLLAVSLLTASVLAAGALATSVDARTTRLHARLSGAAEAPGDPNGAGSAVIRLNAPERRVCFHLSWTRIGAPTAAHIHEGAPGVAGPVVVGLFASASPLPDTIHSVGGCVSGVSRSLIRAIKDHPRHYYVNVHNVEFPAGAIRGQLHR
jgi:hypothetical protein